jgi:hypothetical protein
MNRRKFLSYALGTGTILSTSLGSLSLQGSFLQPPSILLRTLSPKEYGILFAVAEVLIPNNPPFPPSSSLNIAHKVDAVIAQTAPEQQDQLKLVLALIENPSLSTILSFQLHPFTQSTEQEKQERLENWRTGIPQLRSAFKAINGMCNAAYYSSPEIEPLIGYAGPPQHIKDIRTTKGYP